MEMQAGKRRPPKTLRDGAWAGVPAVVVGGGPSLRRFDFPSLRLARLMRVVVNRAFLDVPEAEIVITEDERFLCKFSKMAEWKSFDGVKVFACPDPAYVDRARALDPEILIMPSREKVKGWSQSITDGLSSCQTSMTAALNLVTILGAKPIYVLGLDCRVDGRAHNYHDSYPKEWEVGRVQIEESYRSEIENWCAPNMESRDVVNVIDPEFPSAVKCWRTMTFRNFYNLSCVGKLS